MEDTNSNMVRLAAWRDNTQAAQAEMHTDPGKYAAWRNNTQAAQAEMHTDPGRHETWHDTNG